MSHLIMLIMGKAAYRCRHGHTTATRPDPDQPGNAYLCEDLNLPPSRPWHPARRPGPQ